MNGVIKYASGDTNIKSTKLSRVNPIPAAPPLTTATIGFTLLFKAFKKGTSSSKIPL